MANRGTTWDPKVHCIQDLKELGSKRLPKMYKEYYNEGAMDLITLRENEEAFNRYKIRPRILVNVEDIDTSSHILGQKVSMPLAFAPAAMHKLAHPDGEAATSRAAANFGICMALSAYSTVSLEDVISAGKENPYAIHLCVLRDKGVMRSLIRRAENAGYKALFLSVDAPYLGKRLNEYRNNFALPNDMTWPNLMVEKTETVEATITQDSPASEGLQYDRSLDWDSGLSWVRKETKLQIWLKGVTTAEDTLLAIKHGVDGIIVSNHGGRQLDSQPATLDALRECAAAAAGKIPVALDGGIRRGTDVFKALALGACHVFVGRIPLWGLAYNGQDGVELALKLLMDELKITMGLAGCRSIRDISMRHVSFLNPEGILAKL